MIFAWIKGPRGPAPTRCDDETILALRKYSRVLIEHPIPDDCAVCPLDALALRFPAPEVGDADRR